MGTYAKGRSVDTGPPELQALDSVDALRLLTREVAIRRLYERPQYSSGVLDKVADLLLQCLVPTLAFGLLGVSIWAFGADAAVFLDHTFKSVLEEGWARDKLLGLFRSLDQIFPPTYPGS
ncbi:MAG: hypothetical protein NXI04_03645 [Planctomycetaceae bacterium]|nr:hypothetical protein [Planctomycetaceae bacterium]